MVCTGKDCKECKQIEFEYNWKKEVIEILKVMLKVQQGINLRVMELENARKK